MRVIRIEETPKGLLAILVLPNGGTVARFLDQRRPRELQSRLDSLVHEAAREPSPAECLPKWLRWLGVTEVIGRPDATENLDPKPNRLEDGSPTSLRRARSTTSLR